MQTRHEIDSRPADSTAPSPTHRWAIAAVILGAVALRVLYVGQPMRYDETWMYLNYASQSLGTVLGDYSYPNNHVFHTFLVWISTRVFGNAPAVIRLPTLLAGIALVPLVYRLLQRLGDTTAALIGAALTATMPVLILYTTNARGYVLISVAGILLLLIADRLADGATDRSLWLWFAVITAMGAVTAPVMLYPAGVAGLWLLVERVRRSSLRDARPTIVRLAATGAAAVALALVGYALVIARSGVKPLVSNRFVTPLTPDRFIQSLPDFVVSLRDVLGMGIPQWLGIILALAVVIALVAPSPRRGALRSLAMCAGVWCVVVLVVTRRPPPARVWLFTVPIACVFAGVGLSIVASWLGRGIASRRSLAARLMTAVASAVLVWSVVAQHVVRESEETDYYGLREAPAIARFLLPQLRPNDQIVAARTTELALDYYLLAEGGKRLAQFDTARSGGRVFVVVNERHAQTLANMPRWRPDIAWTTVPTPVVVGTFDRSIVYQTTAPAF
jgi:4-amino-4-deoxy-L-arabinose transferase-like glycosyltransferase